MKLLSIEVPNFLQRFLNFLPFVGLVLVILLIFQSYRASDISERRLNDFVSKEEELRDLQWANLLTQRASIMALTSDKNKDPGAIHRTLTIIESVPGFTKSLRGASREAVLPLLGQIRTEIKTLDSSDVMTSSDKTRSLEGILNKSEKIGEELNRIEAESWQDLLDKSKSLQTELKSRRYSGYFGYILFIFYLGFLGWVSMKKRQAETKLVQAAKMSALGEMAAGIAHEINTPLATIGMMADQIEESLTDDPIDKPMITQMAQEVVRTVKHASTVIQGLRTFSRDSSQGAMESVPLRQVIDNTLSLCRERMKNHQVDLIIAPFADEIRIECRPVQISQVLMNMIGNACDAIDRLQEKWIQIEAKSESGFVSLSITDSGKGIPREIRDKLFQPFFTTKEVGKGTGLGLSISKGIMEAQRGSLTLDESCPNTRFVIKIKEASRA